MLIIKNIMKKSANEMANEMTDFVNTFSTEPRKEFIQAMVEAYKEKQNTLLPLSAYLPFI